MKEALTKQKIMILALIVALFNFNALAKGLRGGDGSGGGDARVAEFMEGTKAVCDWIQSDRKYSHLRQACDDRRELLLQSLQDRDSQRALIYSVQDQDAFDHGVSKDAFTESEYGPIRIARCGWIQDTPEQKLVTEAIEMAILMGQSSKRYEMGAQYAKSDAYQKALAQMKKSAQLKSPAEVETEKKECTRAGSFLQQLGDPKDRTGSFAYGDQKEFSKDIVLTLKNCLSFEKVSQVAIEMSNKTSEAVDVNAMADDIANELQKLGIQVNKASRVKASFVLGSTSIESGWIKRFNYDFKATVTDQDTIRCRGALNLTKELTIQF